MLNPCETTDFIGPGTHLLIFVVWPISWISVRKFVLSKHGKSPLNR